MKSNRDTKVMLVTSNYMKSKEAQKFHKHLVYTHCVHINIIIIIIMAISGVYAHNLYMQKVYACMH